MKRLAFVLLLVALGVGGWFALKQPRGIEQQAPVSSGGLSGATPAPGSPSGTNQDQTPPSGQVTQSPEGAAGLFDKTLGLALQGVSLFQGNKGTELWRLKATWAHLSQTGDVINVDMPVVRYLLGEPGSNDFLDVVSQKGKLTDNQRYLDLWGDVRLTRFDEVVTATLLKYDAATRVMVFPDGAQLEGPTASGTATLLTWDLTANTLVGENGVLVVLKPRESGEGDAQQAPLSSAETAPPAISASGASGGPSPSATPVTGPKVTPVQEKPQTKAVQQRTVQKKKPAATSRKTTQKKTAPKSPASGKASGKTTTTGTKQRP